MSTNITKPYLLEQCQSFVLNKLANEPSDIDGIEASFVIISDDYYLADGSLQYLLDGMVKEGAIAYSEEDGKYSILEYADTPIFSLVNYTAYQLSANYGVVVLDDASKAEGCSLVKSGDRYGIILMDEVVKAAPVEAPLKEEIKELREEPLIRVETKKEKKQREKAQKAAKDKKKQEVEEDNSNVVESLEKEDKLQESTPVEVTDNVESPEAVSTEKNSFNTVKTEENINVEEKQEYIPRPTYVYDAEKARRELEAMDALGMFDEKPAETPKEDPVVEPVKSENEASKVTLEEQEKLATAVRVTETGTAYGEFKTYLAQMDIFNKYGYENILKEILPDRPSEAIEEEPEQDHFISVSSYAELKTQMAKKGILVKPYVNQNAYSYYADNFYFVNRINKDCSIITFAMILLEVLLGYFFFDKTVEKGLIFYLVIALIALVIPFFFIQKYLFFRFKRKKTDYNFRISLATAIMVYLNLMVVIMLLGFFIPSLNVTVDNVNSMIVPIFYPAVLLANIPFYVCVYGILYSTKKYHLH